MTYLRNLWRRGPAHKYFANLEPIDRATALIVLLLLSAFVVSYSAIARHHARPRQAPSALTTGLAALPIPVRG